MDAGGRAAQDAKAESCDGPGMALRSVPLERRWSEATLAQPGPDARCAFVLVTSSLHRTPMRGKEEVTRPRGRNPNMQPARKTAERELGSGQAVGGQAKRCPPYRSRDGTWVSRLLASCMFGYISSEK
jgi:hypothetical protein